MLRRRDLARCTLALAMPAALSGLTACERSRPAPDVAYSLLDGTRHNLKDLRGRVVLVNFWATSCAVCVAEMPRLVALHQQLAGLGYQTLAVAMSYDAPARVSAFAESRSLPFGVVIDNTGEIASAFDDTRVTPTSFLLDRRGWIVKRIVGAPDFEALQVKIEALLKKA